MLYSGLLANLYFAHFQPPLICISKYDQDFNAVIGYFHVMINAYKSDAYERSPFKAFAVRIVVKSYPENSVFQITCNYFVQNGCNAVGRSVVFTTDPLSLLCHWHGRGSIIESVAFNFTLPQELRSFAHLLIKVVFGIVETSYFWS